jgi:cell division protein FtsL
MNASSTLAASATRIERAGRLAIKLGGSFTPLMTAIVLATPVVAAAVFHVWTKVATVRLGYELSEAAQMHRNLLEQNRGLRVEVASLKSPERLETLGKKKYGLHPPLPGQIVRVETPK